MLAEDLTSRSCVVCGALLGTGEAQPVPPEAREGAAEEWLCLDERGCDLRWKARERGRLPVGAAGVILGEILNLSVPKRLELEGPGPVSYLVTSPHGPLAVAGWDCNVCRAGTGWCYREAGTGGDEYRAAAAAHLTQTGHAVVFYRGTREDLLALRTQPETRSTP